MKRSFASVTLDGVAPRACLAFAATLTLAAALLAPEIADIVRQWTWSSSYHHGWLALPLAAWLFADARDWEQHPPRFDWLGAVPLVMAIGLMIAGRALDAALLGHVAIVAAIAGAGLLTLGRELMRRSAFAFGFLVFMVPLGESLIPPLQHAAAPAVAALLNGIGIETQLDGLILTTAAGQFEMAGSCAGLRFLLAATMIAALAAHLAFKSASRKALFIVGAILLAIVANWARAFGIVAAATVTDLKIGTGPEHVAFGWIFYGGLLISLLVLARRFGDRYRARIIQSGPLASATPDVE
ncbi:MAG: exosortase A [Parvularculaceae bacterium]|nr:exosortase A [Parvularculaceae bacterium]